MANKSTQEKNSSRLRRRVQVSFTKPSRTHQSFKDDADINNIMRKYEQTGQLPELIKENPKYGDFSEMADFQEAQNIVAIANEQFAALPAKVRKRFHNDPAEFLEFAQDPKNAKDMVSLGLATERKPEVKQATLNDVVDALKSKDSPSSEGVSPKKGANPDKG